MRRRASRMRLKGMVLLFNKVMFHLLLILEEASNPLFLLILVNMMASLLDNALLVARVASQAKYYVGKLLS